LTIDNIEKTEQFYGSFTAFFLCWLSAVLSAQYQLSVSARSVYIFKWFISLDPTNQPNKQWLAVYFFVDNFSQKNSHSEQHN
jgi:hypothetical protein